MAMNEPILSHRKISVGSDRNFGIVFAVVFTLIGVLPSLHGGEIRWWALVIAAAFGVCAFFAPRLLQPLNRLWFRFGLLLHHVVNPVVMALVYYGAVVPMGLLLKAFGKDLLRLKREPEAASYWIMREPPAPPPGSMAKQF
jgi:predicted membrane metal-binding protein